MISRNIRFALGVALAWLTSNVLKPMFRVVLVVVLVIVFAATAIAVVPQIIISLAPESAYGYAFKYSVSPSQVDVEPKPHDCEFMKAPVGNKYCHFEKEVDVVKDERGEITGVVVTWNKVGD